MKPGGKAKAKHGAETSRSVALKILQKVFQGRSLASAKVQANSLENRERALAMELVQGEFDDRVHQVFRNLAAVASAAGGSLAQIAKLNIYLTDLSNFASVNLVMAEHFQPPYPARAAIGVSELPKGADVEMDAVLVLD